MLFQTLKSFVRLRNTIWDILDENWEACDCPIDCQVITTVESQKSMKSIVRILHLPSVVQSEFYEATRILFVRKENKNNNNIIISTICLLSVSPHHLSAILEIIQWTQTAFTNTEETNCLKFEIEILGTL